MNFGACVVNGARLDIVTSIGSRLNYKLVDAQPLSLRFQRDIGNL